MVKRNKKVKKTVSPKVEEAAHKTRMRIIGIGGGGGSIVSEISSQVSRVDFVAANTDLQALRGLSKKIKSFSFGQSITHGLGCGMDPKLGQRAVKDEKEKIAKLFNGIDVVVLVASLGGGTGSGAAPEFAKIAKDAGLITIGIFTLPFKFEGLKKAQVAKSSLEKLTPFLNAVSTIPNENIFRIVDKTTPIKAAFSAINKRLSDNLQGLIEMIYLPGLVNIDFADLRTVLDGKGKLAYLNSAISEGQNRSDQAIKEVLKSPLNEYSIGGAERILFNITAPQDLKMKEVESISKAISDFNRRAKIIFGVSHGAGYKDKLRISLLAVGMDTSEQKEKEPVEKPKKPESPKKIVKTRAPKVKKKSPPKAPPVLAMPKVSRAGKAFRRPEKKIIKLKMQKQKIKKTSLKPQTRQDDEQKNNLPSALIRRTALDLKKAVEKSADELLEEEKKWDIPAFLRRKEANPGR